MKNKYSKFLFSFFLISIPVIILFILYITFDPFKVARSYDSYYVSGKPAYVTLDKEYVSTQNFLNKASTHQYDSYIFGSSRSIVYDIDTWKNYIHSDNGYHFDANNETLLGINRKIKYLSNNKYNLKNAIIILDSEALSSIEDRKGILWLTHPALANNNNIVSFQLEYFEAFIARNFFFKYFKFKLFNKNTEDFFSTRPIDYNAVRNEITYPYDEKTINDNPSKFYDAKRMKVFFKRDSVESVLKPIIQENQYKLLTEIANIFKAQNTNYRIIINPLYDQQKLNSKDLEILKSIFGNGNVFDFSGKNFITDDYHNYYENSHYRPHIAKYIMKEIYK